MPYCSRDFCSITESRYARYRSIEEDGGRAAQPACSNSSNWLASRLNRLARQIEHLKLVIDKYKRMIFGTKSEKLKGELEQLEFQLEELETEQAARQAQEPHSPRATNKSRPRAPRKPLPEDLPREVITHPPATTCCPDCGGATASVWRRCFRATGTHSGQLQGNSTCAAQVCLRGL